jgi:hypothetical protein
VWYRGTIATTGARYAPALGYVERVDAVRPAAELGYGRVVSSAGHQVRASVTSALAYRNADSAFETGVHAAALALEFPGGAIWTLTTTRQDDDLPLAFGPTPATTVPIGRYTAHFAQLALVAPTGPRAAVGGSVRAGEFYDGTLYSLALTPEWRASGHLRLSADLLLDRIDFPARGQREWSRLARLRVFASATPRLSMSALVQASSVADLATANVRVRYNMREGHDLWVVYGHHENLDRDRLGPVRVPGTARAGLSLKYTHAFGR